MPKKSHYSVPKLKESNVGRWPEHDGETTVPKASFGGAEKCIKVTWILLSFPHINTREYNDSIGLGVFCCSCTYYWLAKWKRKWEHISLVI